MSKKFLNSQDLPFCRGCGHNLISKNVEQALDSMGFDPLDIILVTDIGCHGIIDRYVNSHTVHGLHGRSVALATGIALGMKNRDKKIIVFIGDGGVTIGLQHILEAIRKNIDITVIVHNNMLYGMTGGQASGLTPGCFNTTTTPEGSGMNNYDICAFARISNAAYVSRTVVTGDFADNIAEGIKTEGFSLIEAVELCPSYGIKMNRGMKVKNLIEDSGQELGVWKNENAVKRPVAQTGVTGDLLGEIDSIDPEYSSSIKEPMSVVLSGSAGEAVQTAANYFSEGALSSGLSVNQRGSYPVTVGVGFSSSEIIVSPGAKCPYYKDETDVIIVTSPEGLSYSKKKIEQFRGTLIIDKSLDIPETDAEVHTRDFRGMGARNAAMYSVFYMLSSMGIYPVEALEKRVRPLSEKYRIPLDDMLDSLSLS
ncbi:MAG: thiamine pyrophosphate-dependent enzyme [bacterium]